MSAYLNSLSNKNWSVNFISNELFELIMDELHNGSLMDDF